MLMGILWFFAIRDMTGLSLLVADIVLYCRLADKFDSSLFSLRTVTFQEDFW